MEDDMKSKEQFESFISFKGWILTISEVKRMKLVWDVAWQKSEMQTRKRVKEESLKRLKIRGDSEKV